MVKWFKKLRYIVKHYDSLVEQLAEANRRADAAIDYCDEGRKLIKKRTTAHADIHVTDRAPNYIITIGHYRGHDYIQCFGVHDSDFRAMVDSLRSMAKYQHVDRIDAMPSFSAAIKHEVEHTRIWD